MTDEQGQQDIAFMLDVPEMYTFSLQVKLPGSSKVFAPDNAYTIVQVLEDTAVALDGQAQDKTLPAAKIVQTVARGTALNVQLLLLDSQGQLQQRATTIRFQSSDELAILPQTIQLNEKESGNKLILQGV